MTTSTVLFDAPGPRARRRHRIITIATVAGLIALLGVIIWRFEQNGQLAYELWEPFVTPAYLELIAQATLDTLRTAAVAIVGALVFGVVFATGKLSDHRLFSWPSWLVVEFFRAVPLLMLIFFIWSLYKFQNGLLMPLILGLILYNGSVLAEVFRAGMHAVSRGQVEAAYALGMRKNAVMRLIQFPQAVKIMLPSIVSQCVVALKDTSLGYYILAPGLTVTGREIWREYDNRLQTALVLAAIYILINLLLTWLANVLERRLNRSETNAAHAVNSAATTARA